LEVTTVTTTVKEIIEAKRQAGEAALITNPIDLAGVVPGRAISSILVFKETGSSLIKEHVPLVPQPSQ